MIAATGIHSQQRRLDTIADNVANANTVGFKSGRVEFKDALYTAGFTQGAAPASPQGSQQKGHGTVVTSINKSFTHGSLLASENPMDFALEGEGYFEVMDSYGGIHYTRAGNFYISTEQDGTYLVTSKGEYVLNDMGERIATPQGSNGIEISEAGEISFRGDETGMRDQLGLYTFTNRSGLSYSGSSNFDVTAASGEKIAAENVKVRQGVLESSNVDMAVEMTMLIRAQRAFALASRALSTADGMEGIANNMKK